MPRQAHGRPVQAAGPTKPRKRKTAKGRGLDALETAERDFPDEIKIRQHRLGEAEDDDDDAANTPADAGERSAKRRKVDLNHIEDAPSDDEGSDPDGNPWHVGIDDDDEDSDIDSDEAFGESDEERFADFTFRGSEQNKNQRPPPKQLKRQQQPSRKLDLDEDQHDPISDQNSDEDGKEASDDDLGEDAVDLAAAWDLGDEEERKEQEMVARKKSGQKTRASAPSVDSSEDSAGSDGEEESEADDDQDEQPYSDIEVSDEAQNPETTARLRSFVDGLTPAQQNEVKKTSRSRLQHLPDKPSPFALPSANMTAADLMQYVNDPIQRQSLKILQAAEHEDPTTHKGGIPGKLAAPLAKRQQDRLDRVAAYDQSKQTLDRWVDTVKQNRRAEHVSFPLADTTKASASAVKSFQPASRTEPRSELESKIQEIMRESGYNIDANKGVEDDEQKYEELKTNQIPLEEVQARRRDLRIQRELMFREEVRAKRIKKIKSKAFRRLQRRERNKSAVKEHELMAVAGVLNSDEEREKNDKRRAEERMGSRHRESKWAKAAKATGQTTWNDDAKVGVSDMARRDEELRRRIEGRTIRGSDESASDSGSESSYDSGSADEDDKWNEKLDKLDHAPQLTGSSKLAEMAFMKKAEAGRKAQNDEELRLLRRSIQAENDMSDSDSNAEDAPAKQRYGKATKKRSLTASAPVERLEFEERLSDDEIAEEQEEKLATVHTSLPVMQSTIVAPATTKQGARPSQQATGILKEIPARAKLPSQQKPRDALQPTGPQQQQSAFDDNYTSPSESEHEGTSLDHRDQLALDIFAGDDEEDLRKQFEIEKKELIEEEDDQVIDNTLPGWGSWTGAGVSKKEQKKAKGRFLTTVKGITPEARKDARLDRVIINEKRNKKNGKYLATELPHPFESRQQYERSLRLPMGPEWSTRNHFQDAIKPRVLLKQGQAIKPMAKPLI